MLGKLPGVPKAPEATKVQIAALPQRIGVKVSDAPQGVQEDELAGLSAAVQQLHSFPQGQKPGPAASMQTASKGFSLRNRHQAATLSAAMEEPSERAEREPTLDAEALSKHRPVLSQDVQQMVANLEATVTALEAAGEDVLNNPEVQEVVAQATALLAGIEAEAEPRTHPLPEPIATRAREEAEIMDAGEHDRDADAEFPEEAVHRGELLAIEEREERTVPADEDLQAAAALMAEEDEQEPHMPEEELHMDVDLAAVGPGRSRQWTKLHASIDDLPAVSISAKGQTAAAKVAATAAAVAGPVKPAAKATAAAQPQAAKKPSVAAAGTVDVSATDLTQLLSDLSALVDAAETASAKQA